jgi:hypothetical protein
MQEDILKFTLALVTLIIVIPTNNFSKDFTKETVKDGVIELPVQFGKFKYLRELDPGTFFWSESDQRIFLVLSGKRYCDPKTGEQWEFRDSDCGTICTATVRPNSFDLRPWVAPNGDLGDAVNAPPPVDNR